MPPRFAYWTITIDNQPTAFRAREVADIMPTFKRLKERHPSALLMWFERGKLWNAPEEARLAMRERAKAGRRRPGSESREPRAQSREPRAESPEPRAESPEPRAGTWRPGGEHRDPRQKYRDAKKARWQRFKQRIRGRGRQKP
jgi:hypothetical protein